MNIKRSVLIITFLAILVWSFGYLPMAKAETMEEISAQIATLRNQITEYQKKIAELQIEIAKLLAKQISIVQSQIAQLQTELLSKTPVKPETEWKCPDLNADGQVDMRDIGLVSGIVNACSGQTKYNATADVDSNNCITSADLDYVTKYFGKKIEEISQCAGAIITHPTLSVTISANPSSGVIPLNGVDLTAKVWGTATGPINYTFYCNRTDTGTNITSGWCHKKDGVTQTSYTATDCCNFSKAGTYTAKVIVDRGSLQAETRVNIQVSPKTESEWKCPDVNGDGIVNMRDIGFVTNKTNTCSGQANYDPTADMDGDNCITTTDVNYVSKYFGKKTSEIAQCK